MARTQTNNRDTDQQLGEMDYVLFHIDRIANELRENGVSVPGRVHPPPSATEVPPLETEVSTAKTSRSLIYLPGWLRKHCDDPAMMVRFIPLHTTCH